MHVYMYIYDKSGWYMYIGKRDGGTATTQFCCIRQQAKDLIFKTLIHLYNIKISSEFKEKRPPHCTPTQTALPVSYQTHFYAQCVKVCQSRSAVVKRLIYSQIKRYGNDVMILFDTGANIHVRLTSNH